METKQNSDIDIKIKNRESWFKVIILSAMIGVLLYKIIITPISIQIQNYSFSELLTLLLSLFAVVLSVLFYFKANESSNIFYNDTYHFSKDMSEILGRIEAGFGERLRHIDEGYKGVAEHLRRFPLDEERVQASIEKEENVVEEKERERELVIADLLKKAKLQEKEKDEILEKFRFQDEELDMARQELLFLKHRSDLLEARERSAHSDSIETSYKSRILNRLIKYLGGPQGVKRLSPSRITSRFKSIVSDFSERDIYYLRRNKYINSENELTPAGIRVIRKQADWIMTN